MDLVCLKAVDDRAARLLQLLGKVDVVLFVEARAQLHNGNDLLAVFGRGDKRLDDLGFMCHAVQRHFDGNHVRVLRSLVEHADEGPDALVRIRKQYVLRFHHTGKIKIRRRQHGTLHRVKQLGMAVLRDARGYLEANGHIQRRRLLKHLFCGQHQLFAQEPDDLRRSTRRCLQANGRQLAALFQKIAHDLAIVHVVVEHAFIHCDIRIARHAENAPALHGVLAEDQAREMFHHLFHQCKGDRAARRHKYDTLELRADGYQTKGRLRVSLSLQNGADIHLIVAQKRKGMPPVDDLRRKDGKYLLHEIFAPEMLRFFAQVRKIHPAVAQHTHILIQLRHNFIAVLLQLRDLRHNGVQLLSGRHARLVLFFIAAHQRTVVQRPHAYHEKFIQIARVNGGKLQLLANRDRLVLRKVQDAPVEFKPAQLPVDEYLPRMRLFHKKLPFK